MILQDILNPIVFSAYKSSNSDYSSREYIKDFNGFLTYETYIDCFDLASGIFTTPRPGVYEFSAAVTHANRGYNLLIVEKSNGEVLKFGTADTSAVDGDGSDILSFSWIMELNQGETVRLKVGNNGKFEAFADANWVFNGKFIRNGIYY